MYKRDYFIWKQVPLLRCVFVFIGGIIFAIFSPHILMAWFFLGLVAITAILSWFVTAKWFIPVWYLMFACVGFGVTSFLTERLNPTHLHQQEFDGEQTFLVYIVNDPIERERSIKLEVRVLQLLSSDSNQSIEGKLLVYLQKDTAAIQLRYGDTIAIQSYLNSLNEPSNPDEFNYKRYLGFHQITEQTYVTSDNWLLIGKGSGFKRSIIEVQRYVIEVLKSFDLNERQLAIVSALLVGYKHYLTADQVNAFASAGAMHVLAVSGLHVGIVFLILNTLLKPLQKRSWTRWLKAFLLLAALWLYAAITGFSPSVTRAVTMFSFVIVSQLINRRTSIYNALAASALVLLIYNPFFIVEVGFQLSYVAVLGIVILQPRIYEWWQPKNYFLDKIWGITAVSLAAQIATFPLGLLYFHQFPNYFLISNLLVIPLATAILPVGIALIVFSKVAYVSSLLAFVLYWLVWLLDWFVDWVEKLPLALIQGIDINILETYIIYMIVATFIMVLIIKSYFWQRIFLGSVLVIFILNSTEAVFQSKQKEIVFYAVKGHDAIDFIDGNNHVFIADSGLINDEDKMRFHIMHHWWKLDLKRPQEALSSLIQAKNGYLFDQQTILVLDSNNKIDDSLGQIDILFLKERTAQDPKEILSLINPDIVIISSKMDWRSHNSWLYNLEDYGVESHSLKRDGAYRITLDN